MIFTLPALILLGAWTSFNYLEGTLLITLGGVLGVLIAFSQTVSPFLGTAPSALAVFEHSSLSFHWSEYP